MKKVLIVLVGRNLAKLKTAKYIPVQFRMENGIKLYLQGLMVRLLTLSKIGTAVIFTQVLIQQWLIRAIRTVGHLIMEIWKELGQSIQAVQAVVRHLPTTTLQVDLKPNGMRIPLNISLPSHLNRKVFIIMIQKKRLLHFPDRYLKAYMVIMTGTSISVLVMVNIWLLTIKQVTVFKIIRIVKII